MKTRRDESTSLPLPDRGFRRVTRDPGRAGRGSVHEDDHQELLREPERHEREVPDHDADSEGVHEQVSDRVRDPEWGHRKVKEVREEQEEV